MTRTLTIRPAAEADLSTIWDHTVERWSPMQANDYFTGLDRTLALLCQHPEMARLHDLVPPVRLFAYRSHLIVFSASDVAVEVIRILHFRSNWRELLRE